MPNQLPQRWNLRLHRQAVQGKYKFQRGEHAAAAVTRALEQLQRNPFVEGHHHVINNIYATQIDRFLFTYEVTYPDPADPDAGLIRVLDIE